MSNIGKINIDFQVLKTSDTHSLLIADTSDWKHIEGKTSIIKITMPGGSKPSENYFDKHKVNIFNSSILGITPKACDRDDLASLPDGIYTIEVIGSPDTFRKKRYHLRTEKLQLQVDKLYVSTGLDFSPSEKSLREELYNIDFMIKAAESAIRLGDIKKAGRYFREAKSLVDFYNNCNDCH